MLFSRAKKKVADKSPSERENNHGPDGDLLDEIDQARADLMLARLEMMRRIKAGSDRPDRSLEAEDNQPAAKPANTVNHSSEPQEPQISQQPAEVDQPPAAARRELAPVEVPAATSQDRHSEMPTHQPQQTSSAQSPPVPSEDRSRARQGGDPESTSELFNGDDLAAQTKMAADDFLDDLMSHIVRDDIALHKNELIRGEIS